VPIFRSSLNIPPIQSALSNARLSSYQSLIGVATAAPAIGAYVWGLELNAALSPVLSMVEVVLRNRLHAAASAQFAKSDWYQDVLKHHGDLLWHNKIAVNPSITNDYYRKGAAPHDKKSIWNGTVKKPLKHWRSPAEGKLEEILQRLAKSGKPRTPDHIVAHAMFGFWLMLLAPNFESPTDPLALWPGCAAQTFPSDAAMTRGAAFSILERVKNLRNRISHHEPAWRMAAVLTPAGVHTTLSHRVQEMRELLDAMSPDITRLLDHNGIFERLRWLLDPQTIAAFSDQRGVQLSRSLPPHSPPQSP
jgi:hypothetical protein